MKFVRKYNVEKLIFVGYHRILELEIIIEII